MNRHLDRNISKETLDLKNTLYLKDLTDMYRKCHPTFGEYTFFSVMPGYSPRSQIGPQNKSL